MFLFLSLGGVADELEPVICTEVVQMSHYCFHNPINYTLSSNPLARVSRSFDLAPSFKDPDLKTKHLNEICLAAVANLSFQTTT